MKRKIEDALIRSAEMDAARINVDVQGPAYRSVGSSRSVVVAIRPDPRFERRNADLFTAVRAPFTTLLLGGEARVPTPDGKELALTIPPGTQDGRVFRLRGRGMPVPGQHDRRGDLHAEVHALLPERLTARERELVQELAGSTASASGTRR